MNLRPLLVLLTIALTACPIKKEYIIPEDITYSTPRVSDFWKRATIYFLLTDRFYNGNKENDIQYQRKPDGAVLRNFEGGDIAGINEKIISGYFDSLGVDAIWFTPVFAQIEGHTDEGTGKTYAYHGYWTRDWTALDPNFGTEEELAIMVKNAHDRGIRVLLDAVVNHTGPVTEIDAAWPDDWVRRDSTCKFDSYERTVTCMLVDNLPDIRTEGGFQVNVPEFLVEKWKSEKRYQKEVQSLRNFFDKYNNPKLPHFYIVKWLADWVRKYGIDGFRVDTAKHTEAYVWSALKRACQDALEAWRKENPEEVKHEDPFYMVGEVYGYGISNGSDFNFGDSSVNFFDYGFESLINFEFKYDANESYEFVFEKYSELLQEGNFQDKTVVNYLSSHDDGDPFDMERQRTFEAGNKLLLSPGSIQIYYGDETMRPLVVEGANGDANLRSFMNWDNAKDEPVMSSLQHWQKLGKFRKEHPSVGGGMHKMISAKPYFFSRQMENQKSVVIGLDLNPGAKEINMNGIFKEGENVRDHYSGREAVVINGKLSINTSYKILLLSATD